VRALVLTPDFPPARGGIQLLSHRVASHLDGTTTRVLALGTGDSSAWDAAQALDVRRVRQGRDHRLGLLRLNVTALTEARRFRPDVVLCTHIVVTPAAAAIRRLRGVPFVTYLHANEVTTRARLAAFAVRESDRVVAVSAYTAELARAAGVDPARLRRIAPGVDWREPPRGERRATPTVVTVARMEDRYKGHDVMARALPLVRSQAPGAEWVVIGDGPLRQDVARLATAQGVGDAVRLVGAVSDAERDRWLDCAHVFAMPSRLPAAGGAGEGFGIVFLEAGVHGLPVVAGAVGGALDSVVDGETGLLVDPTDHVQVADAIARLLCDPALARRMGDAGSARAREFAWPAVGHRVGEVLAEVAGCA
jgi:phosphatidylinositol alpha-1,6-mannosyltransferase